MNGYVRPQLKLALTLFIVLAVYFQSISHPFSRFDDPGIVGAYGLNSALSFFDVLTPGGGFYYRPFVSLSYWIDSRLWGMDPAFMHLENIVAHLINVFLVFLIASRLPISSETKYLPFLSALLFGLHPINSESINWIPGRTDLYAGVFIFLAFYCLICALQKQSTKFALAAFGVFLVGSLTKETAVMFVPAAFLLSVCWPETPQDDVHYITWRTRFLIVPIVISVCFVSLILLLVFLRGDGNNAISLIFEGKTNIFLRSLEAFGFYVKKLFLPLPLNVAIVEVNSYYSVAGSILLVVLGVAFRRTGFPGIFLAISALFILPALLIAVTSFTWTPFGERYLYISSAFAVIACLELLYRLFVRWNAVHLYLPVITILIVFAALASIQRSMLWNDNLALLEDVVSKSPNFGVIRNEYGVLLKQAGRYDEAEKQFKIGLQLNNKEHTNRILRLNLIWLKIRDMDKDEARLFLLSEIGNKANADIELLKQLNRYDESLLRDSDTLTAKKRIVSDIIETNEALYLKTDEAYYLYRSGQLLLFVGNNHKAAAIFKKAYENAKLNEYYREPARKLAQELSEK